jgi:methylthioribose-1-phosphate isomerase
MQFQPLEPGIEVSGQSLGAFVQGFKAFRSIANKYMEMYGLVRAEVGKKPFVDTTRWYAQEAWLKAYECIVKEIGYSVLFDIGASIPQNAIFPPWIKDVDTAIQSIDVAYHMNHRKAGVVMFDEATGVMLEGIGHYGYRRIPAEQRIVSVCDTPYPCEVDFGIVSAMAEKFQRRAKTVHDEAAPCRKRGDRSCRYVVTW